MNYAPRDTKPLKTSVLVLAPTGRDTELICGLLDRNGIPYVSCSSLTQLVAKASEGSGPVVIADEGLGGPALGDLLKLLDQQPEWSDLPVIILSGRRPDPERLSALASRRATTILSRPLEVATLLSVIATAMTARRRQYEVSDLLVRLQGLTGRLGDRADQLQLLTSEITEAESRERQRIADVLHGELQQILVAIHVALGSVEDTKDERVRKALEKSRMFVDQAVNACRHLSHELSPPVLRYAGLTAAIDGLAEEMESKYGLRVTLRCADDVTDVDESLRVFLFDSLREILVNTVKHAEAREAAIELDREEDSALRISVADNGKGFDPSKIRMEGGSEGGFGLFSIKERLALLGGKLDIESSPGHGSRVTLHTPKNRLRPDKALPQPVAAAGAAPGGESLEKVRIVVADDHDMVRSALVSLLSKESDIEVVGEAEDGLQAVKQARKLLPDVVVMDVSMPVLDGVDATRMVRTELPQVQVIGLSAFRENAIAQSMIDAGACVHLLKDQASETLINAIRSCRKSALVSPG